MLVIEIIFCLICNFKTSHSNTTNNLKIINHYSSTPTTTVMELNDDNNGGQQVLKTQMCLGPLVCFFSTQADLFIYLQTRTRILGYNDNNNQ